MNSCVNFETECLVVGNGPSVLDTPLGNIIDSFGAVVRINNFVTEGMEAIVGRRTDIWVHNAGPLIRPRNCDSFRRVVGCTPLFDRFSDTCHEYIARECIDAIRDRFSPLEGSKFPSTGLFTIGYLLTRHDRVFIHGFDHFAPGRHHYFETGGDPSPHSQLAEKKFVESWILERKVIRLTEMFASTATCQPQSMQA